MFDLIISRRGKEQLVMTGNLPKVKDRLKTLRKSLRKGIKGERVTFDIRETGSTDKFKKKPHNISGISL